MLLTGRPCCNTILIIKSRATTTDKSANNAASDFSGSDHSPRIFYSLASRLSSLSLTRRLLNPGEKEISRTGAERSGANCHSPKFSPEKSSTLQTAAPPPPSSPARRGRKFLITPTSFAAIRVGRIPRRRLLVTRPDRVLFSRIIGQNLSRPVNRTAINLHFVAFCRYRLYSSLTTWKKRTLKI